MFDPNFLKPSYVTRDDFFQVKGLKLELELPESDDPANDPERFIFRIEQKVLLFLQKNYRFHPNMINKNTMNRFKLGIIEQINYELCNGQDAAISETAQYYFRSCGFMNVRCF